MKRIILILTILIITLPIFNAYGAGGQGIWKDTQCAANSEHGGPTEPCNFCDALVVANNIITMLMKYALIIAGVMIVVGAVTIMISAGNSKLLSRGKKTITKALVGAAVSLLSYLIVGTFIHVLSGNADFPWTRISCNNPIYQSPGSQTIGNEGNKGKWAKIDARGVWHCDSSCSSIPGTNPNTDCYDAATTVANTAINCNELASLPIKYTFGIRISNDSAVCAQDQNKGSGCYGINSIKLLRDKGLIKDEDVACNIVPTDLCSKNPTLYEKIANDGKLACSAVKEFLKVVDPTNGKICRNFLPFEDAEKYFCGQNIVDVILHNYSYSSAFFAKKNNDGSIVTSTTDCNFGPNDKDCYIIARHKLAGPEESYYCTSTN